MYDVCVHEYASVYCVYVCMYTSVGLCVHFMCVGVYVSGGCICICICVCVCMCIYISCACMHVLCTCLGVCMNMCVWECTHVCVYIVYACLHVCEYLHLYVFKDPCV